jgi:hypothetical protein
MRSYLQRLRNLLGLRGELRRGRNEHVDDDSNGAPGWVVLTKRSQILVDLASQLASDGREDDAAVRQLASVVGRHHHELKIADRYFRVSSQNHEYQIGNRAWRLIQAAMNGSSVAPVSKSDETLFTSLARLRGTKDLADLARLRGTKDLAEVYGRLAERAPDLKLVEGEVRRGQLAPGPLAAKAGGSLDVPAELGLGLQIRDRLATLLGPDAQTSDPILKSQTAIDLASNYLVGLTDTSIGHD